MSVGTVATIITTILTDADAATSRMILDINFVVVLASRVAIVVVHVGVIVVPAATLGVQLAIDPEIAGLVHIAAST